MPYIVLFALYLVVGFLFLLGLGLAAKRASSIHRENDETEEPASPDRESVSGGQPPTGTEELYPPAVPLPPPTFSKVGNVGTPPSAW